MLSTQLLILNYRVPSYLLTKCTEDGVPSNVSYVVEDFIFF